MSEKPTLTAKEKTLIDEAQNYCQARRDHKPVAHYKMGGPDAIFDKFIAALTNQADTINTLREENRLVGIMVDSRDEQITEAQADLKRLERHEQSIIDNGYSGHGEIIAAVTILKAEIERLRDLVKRQGDHTDEAIVEASILRQLIPDLCKVSGMKAGELLVRQRLTFEQAENVLSVSEGT